MHVDVVVIDDLRSFPPGHDVIYLRNAACALTFLGNVHGHGNSVGQLWLDHDLGDGVDIGPVVTWLCEQAFNDEPFAAEEILVHSMNAAVVESMVKTLARWYPKVRRVDAITVGLAA